MLRFSGKGMLGKEGLLVRWTLIRFMLFKQIVRERMEGRYGVPS